MEPNALARGGRSAWDCDEMTEDCDNDDSVQKPITVLDEKTGLMVIERESDSEWNQSPNQNSRLAKSSNSHLLLMANQNTPSLTKTGEKPIQMSTGL